MESDNDLNFLEIINDSPDNKYWEGIPSCVGNYVKQNESILQQLGKKVMSIKQPIDMIAEYGGSLNCLVGSL